MTDGIPPTRSPGRHRHRPRPRLHAAAAAAAAWAAGAALLAAPPASAAAGCSIDYTVNQWNNGFTAEVAITNLGDPIDGWTLEWEFADGQNVTGSWNGEATQSGSRVRVDDASYNAAIPSGGTVEFGFQATHTGTNGAPRAFTLNGTVCDGSTGDGDGDGDGDDTSGRQVEALGRGPVSVRSGDGNLVSWRMLATDPGGVAFNVYRGGTRVNPEPLTGATSYLDSPAPSGADYTVRPVVDGQEQEASPSALRFGRGYLDVPLQRPAGGSTPDGSYSYSANDAGVGDLDGDGAYEIVLKWQPSNAKDNSQSGYTGSTIVDAYELDGTRLWRVDLGRNIRAGAHYTQFSVYDLDGDGAAEVAMKTADGTVDGRGEVIGDAGADHRDDSGYILSGPEYLTVFEGADGSELSTVDYRPSRGNVGDWGDDYGNRVDRFLAGVAYLDGERPSLIMARGYYTRSVLVAWDWRDGRLTERWTFDSDEAGSAWAGQGNHQLSIADADGDGRDEVVYGAMAVDDDGSGLWNTGYGHGDALHVGDFLPERGGLEVFDIQERTGGAAGAHLDDAATGETLWRKPTADGQEGPGRGVAADVWAGNPGAEFWAAGGGISGLFDGQGNNIGRTPSSTNFVAWWDGDPVRELLDGTHIDSYGPEGDERLLTGEGVASNNGTKSTPALSGDILGDWREEVVWRTEDSSALRIYSTPHPTSVRMPTLMHDTQYRVAMAWQNTAYNQPPHPSYFIGDGMDAAPVPDVHTS
ncbi:rhamnogalacturonan lyase family protein [Streptomonospora wellingtoniae]|uniref:Cellulose binding domain-containing protein n=1 Tax=Streptomonospora wellingtoniae TaxID=3075544 RepID=A0ABU2KW30_9ACTN|nr:cellulose binding domain-containing protein [Streptomonospora sp. DSM 45055]MDT0303501.1 cellulose binding domain-containing protein [Streptomonospora sp. DSM 45055]